MPPVPRSSGPSDGDRFGNPDHTVQHCDGHGRFALLAGQCAGAERGADQSFVPADCGLDETTAAVSGRSLPTHAALFQDEPDMTVTRTLRVWIVRARHRRRSRRNDHVRRWVMLPRRGRLVDGLAVIGAVRDHTRDAAFGLPKREVEDEPLGQHQLDRQVRVERLPTGRRSMRRDAIPPAPPRRARRLHRHAASARPRRPASSSPGSVPSECDDGALSCA
jgi:hypothetical protein